MVAIAGSGKTRALAETLARQAVAHTVVACPTILRINEVEDWLKQFGVTVAAAVIHPDQNGDRATRQHVWKWFTDAAKTPDPRGGILVCSHATVLDMGAPPAIAGASDRFFR